MEKLRKIGFSKLTFLEEALKQLFSRIIPCSIEETRITKALNRILGEDIRSSMNIPPFDRSAMDGYALRAEDTFGASPNNPKRIKLIGTIEIGETSSLEVNAKQGIRISTGAPVPNGADAVIKIEETEIEDNTIILYAALVPGKNISKEGEDIKMGLQVLNKGVNLKAEHLALLASLGYKRVKVFKKPYVSVFSSGDELLEPGEPLQPGKIYNSNTPMISSLVDRYGGNVVRGETVKDDKDIIKNRLFEAAKDSQIIIFTGGTSVGTKDYLPEIINDVGEILVHGIAQRPGAPVLIGIIRESIVFCLPGTPVAAYVSFLKIAGIAIRKMSGSITLDPRIEIIATINKDVPVTGLGILHYLRVKIEKVNEEFIAIPMKLKGSGIISSLTESDGIIEIPPNKEGLRKGERVIVKLFPK
ncbi:MAG: molybdopterin molybdotransferase MoeA [Promethearchaeota archaeon]